MQITELKFKKRESYEDLPNQLVGAVTLCGPTGKQEIILSSMAMSKIFSVIKDELISTSTRNAALTANAVDEAIHQPLLADVATVGQLPF